MASTTPTPFTYAQIRANIAQSYPQSPLSMVQLASQAPTHRMNAHRWRKPENRHMRRSNLLLARAMYSIAREYARALGYMK